MPLVPCTDGAKPPGFAEVDRFLRLIVQTVLAGVLLFGLPPFAGADVLLSDTLDYPDGPLVVVSGGKWVTHSGATNEVQVISSRAFLTESATEDVNALLSGGPYPAASGVVVYAKLRVNFSSPPGSAGAYFAHFKDGGTQFRCRIYAATSGAAPGSFRLGLANAEGSPNVMAPVDLNLDTDYTLIVRYAASNAVSRLWISPASESDDSVTATDSATGMNLTAFALRQAGGIGAVFVDAVAVGTSFDEVLGSDLPVPPEIVAQPQSQAIVQGGNVSFEVVAQGSPPLQYQWFHEGEEIPGATATSVSLSGITPAQAGTYHVVVSNGAGWVMSEPATLTVNIVEVHGVVSLLNYNVKGNGVSDWSTNAAQIQAIGRQVMYLQPDLIAFQEIPNSRTHEMTNFVKAFLPDYFLATNSGTDNFIRSVIVSRFPIVRSESWLWRSSLTNFGYDGLFTRDLFEAEIQVPGASEPMHIFTTHLKAATDADSAARRAAEASAISNFFATLFLPAHPHRPYVLTGDLNEDIDRPPSTSQQPIQRLVNPGTGLFLNTPVNPITQTELTFNFHGQLTRRIDYILTGALLHSNILDQFVFRTDVLDPLPAGLESLDSVASSDHLPLFMVFNYPDPPLRTTAVVTNEVFTLTWPTLIGREYSISASPDLLGWSVVESNLTATSTAASWSTAPVGEMKSFQVIRTR